MTINSLEKVPIQVLGFFDSPMTRDYRQGFDNASPTFLHMAKTALRNKIFNDDVANQDCMTGEHYSFKLVGGDFETQLWKCYVAEHFLPHVKVPFIVIADQYDPFELN